MLRYLKSVLISEAKDKWESKYGESSIVVKSCSFSACISNNPTEMNLSVYCEAWSHANKKT